MTDTTFTLDPKQFLEALDKMSSKMDAMTASAERTAKATEKQSENTGSWVVAKGMLMAQGVAMMAQKVFNGIMAGIPEIGKTFDIVSDILQRNLLYPLRQELTPILQRILDWFRDNRAMFARWGSYLVSVFRIIKSAVLGVVDIIKDLWKKMSSGIEKIFGKTTSTITEMINLIVFKVAFFVGILRVMLGAVFDLLADIVLKAIENWNAFTSGIKDGIGDTTPIIEGFMYVWQQFKSLMKDILGMDMKGIFSDLGSILGGAVKVGLIAIVNLLDTMFTMLKAIKLVYKAYKGELNEKDFMAQIKELDSEAEERFAKRKKIQSDTMGQMKDTLLGTKKVTSETHNKTENGGDVYIEQTISIDGGDPEAVKKAIADANKSSVNDIKNEKQKSGANTQTNGKGYRGK